MAKKITAQVKLQIPAGKATPAPPVGTALGPQGVNIMDFCKAFNAKTSGKDQQIEEIAKIKMPDLNCFELEAAMQSVRGTARSMGVDVV